ncbi:uncharacterized protein LOC123388307 [Mustela putorius furo]|uniref:Uncharacterized protein LOC123388307 n=1 Tax=Mustela putorius furo TaxID=9669 RepID=A0A8U0RGQ1_MUSPF|nr:uncharacterized protein LOC123388307 [Mustela putorius furo]
MDWTVSLARSPRGALSMVSKWTLTVDTHQTQLLRASSHAGPLSSLESGGLGTVCLRGEACGGRAAVGRRGKYPRPGVETWPAAEQSTGAKTAQGSRPSSGPARTAPELTSPEAGSSGRGSPARSREGPAVPGAAERVPEARGVVVLRLRPPRGGSDSVELVAGSGREPRFRTGVRRKWWCCASAAGLWELGRAPTARRGPRPGVALSAALLPPTQPSPGGVQSMQKRRPRVRPL